jgi:hypothetical protein
MELGTKVLMKKSNAKWYLDHPEVYTAPSGRVDKFYDAETLTHLMCAFDVPVTGVVTSYGSSGCYFVFWKVAGIKTGYYVERKHVTKLEGLWNN